MPLDNMLVAVFLNPCMVERRRPETSSKVWQEESAVEVVAGSRTRSASIEMLVARMREMRAA
jgi:hypothetical protein